MPDIEARVRQVVEEILFCEPDRIRPEARFAEDLDADSLNQVELVMAIEEEFQLPEIPDSDAEAIHTVQQAVDYVRKALGE